MTELSWTSLRDKAIRSFNGELPNPQTEQDLIDAFQANPAAVTRTLDDVTEQHAAGSVRSGWAVWRSRTLAVHSASQVTATVGDKRELRIHQAEQWIRNAGLHIDRDSELLDDLFGDFGRLRDWASDEPLRERMLRLWRDQRPRGEHAEREAIGRGLADQELRARLAAARKAALTPQPEGAPV